MDLPELCKFLTDKMSMTKVYQPVIIRELLAHDGECTKTQLAIALTEYDLGILERYRAVVMRYPKETLEKHGVIRYERRGERFLLNCKVDDKELTNRALRICKQRIEEWIETKKNKEQDPIANTSVRYRVLKRAKGKCELCGIPKSLRPIDIDHITPKSKADKNGTILRDGIRMGVHDEGNLQALCYKCNRGKRDADDTDFRRALKLVRDKFPSTMPHKDRNASYQRVSGKARINALKEKLVEEHEEFIQSGGVDELADMVEVILHIADEKGVSQKELFKAIENKRNKLGGFKEGILHKLEG